MVLLAYISTKNKNANYRNIDVLKVLTVQDDQPAKALGLLKEVSTFRFVLVLDIMEKLLEAIHCLSYELQNPKILLPAAMDLVDLTRK